MNIKASKRVAVNIVYTDKDKAVEKIIRNL